MIKTFFEKLDESASIENNRNPKGNAYKNPSNLTDLVGKVQRLQRGHESKLEKLAEQEIRENYGKILEHVDLHIRFAKSDEIQKMIKESLDRTPKSSLDILIEDGIISESQERKISQNILAGELKVIRKILNSTGILEKFENIFGSNSKAMEYQSLLVQMNNVASSLDWKIPSGVQLKMWESHQSSFSGSNQISWETPLDQNSAETLAQEILRGFEDSEEIPQRARKLFNESFPAIKATGTDFVTLIKESLSGIYSVISASAIPEESEIFEGEMEEYPEDFDMELKESESNYSKMTLREIQDLFDESLESGHYDTAREIGSFLEDSERKEALDRIQSEIGYL